MTAAHKEPVYRLACGMFAEECRKVARDYPDVTFEEAMIDTISMKLVMAPQQYDVVVTSNQFGDILTDIGAGLVGGLGLAPGLCVGERQAMAQATHGSAPDIAGRNIANPYAMIASGQMLLAFLGRKHNEPKATAAAGLHAGGDRQGRHRSQTPDQRPGRQGQHPGDGRRHRGGRPAIARPRKKGSVMYNLHLSPEQLEIRDTVRDFVTREIKPVALKAERLDVCDRSLLTGSARPGLADGPAQAGAVGGARRRRRGRAHRRAS